MAMTCSRCGKETLTATVSAAAIARADSLLPEKQTEAVCPVCAAKEKTPATPETA